MNVEELISIGSTMLAAERQATEIEAREQAAARAADQAARLEAVREALGLDEATFKKFEPEYKEGRSPNVTLTFRGGAIGFSVSPVNGGYAVRAGNCSTGHIEYLAREMAKILEEHEQQVARTINDLQQPIAMWWSAQYFNARRAAVWSTPGVLAARAEYLMRVYTSGLLDRESHSINDWLNYTAELVSVEPALAEIRADLAVKADLMSKRDWLLRCIENRRHPETDEVIGLDDDWDEDRGRHSDMVTREEVEVYRAAAVSEGLSDDTAVLAAIAKREQQMLDAELQADVEQKRVALEAKLFQPFTYYTVSYGVMADADDEQMVITEEFDAFHDEPGDDGYWTTVHGKRVKPTFAALIERREVKTVHEMRCLPWRYRLQRNTEFGTIYVPPQVAEVTR